MANGCKKLVRNTYCPKMDQPGKDHHANQLNPNNAANKAAADNRSNQLNPNNKEYASGSQGGEK